MVCSPPGLSVHGISQARILEWVGISFSRGSSPPRDKTHISCLSHLGIPFIIYYLRTYTHTHTHTHTLIICHLYVLSFIYLPIVYPYLSSLHHLSTYHLSIHLSVYHLCNIIHASLLLNPGSCTQLTVRPN